MSHPPYIDLFLHGMPVWLVLAGGLLVLLGDFLFPATQEGKGNPTLGFALAAVLLALLSLVTVVPPASWSWPRGLWISNPFTRLLQLGLLLLALPNLCLELASKGRVRAERLACALFGLGGMMVMVVAGHLVTVLVGLELASLSLYALVGLDQRQYASEAALKYLLYGGVATALMVFGTGWIYGWTGSLEISVWAERTHGLEGWSPMLMAGICLLGAGLAFKIAAAPMHFWVPEVYRASGSATASWVAGASKLAAFLLAARLLIQGLGDVGGSAGMGAFQPGWIPWMATLAVCSMILGNLGALAQRSVRGLLGFSAVAHSGYALLALVAGTTDALAALVYYSFTYAIGVVGVIALVDWYAPRSSTPLLSDLQGMWQTKPSATLALVLLVLSLAGIPPLAGFLAKFLVFARLLASPQGGGLIWLVLLAVLASAVGLYYYLQLLKAACVTEEGSSKEESPERGHSIGFWIGWACAVGVLVTGLLPQLCLGFISRALEYGF